MQRFRVGKQEPRAITEWRYWMERAEEARTQAEGFSDPEAREIMFRMAEEYERLTKLLTPRPRRKAMEKAE